MDELHQVLGMKFHDKFKQTASYPGKNRANDNLPKNQREGRNHNGSIYTSTAMGIPEFTVVPSMW